MSEEEPKTGWFMPILIGTLLTILAAILFIPDSKIMPETVTHNYFTFEKVGGLWQTYIDLDGQLYEAIFRFNPEQVTDVYVTGNFSGFSKQPIYITFDPNAQDDQFKYLALASTELSLHIVRALNFSVTAACTKNETDACKDRPIVTCESNKSVIYLVPTAPTQITLDKSCVTLSGDGMDLLKSVDRLLFQWYHIFKAPQSTVTIL